MVKIGHASIDERGKISGGVAGDQNGKEVCIRDWWSKPWTHVIRFKTPLMRVKVADCMIKACNNRALGYDQSQRNTLLNACRNFGYDPSKVTIPCETDCSALVTLCCLYAGIQEKSLVVNGNSATTSVLRKRLQATGAVDVFTGKEYTTRSDKLMRGDILLSEGHHVAIVVDVPQKTSASPTEPISVVALRVIEGDYGTGEKRRRRLLEAGYNPDEVQKEVNRLLKR